MKKERAYISGGIGIAVSALLFIVAYDLPQGFYKKFIALFGLFFFILSLLSFWRPKIFGIFATRIFLGNSKK